MECQSSGRYQYSTIFFRFLHISDFSNVIYRSLDVEKIFKINSSDIPSKCDTRVFLIYSDLILVKYICDHINAEAGDSGTRVKFYIILIPRKLFSVMQLLEEEGVYEYVTVFSFSWELIPLDGQSILSLEFKQFFSHLFVHGDHSLLPVAAKSIWSSFLLWGTPAVRISIGNHSQSICNIVDSYYKELAKPDRTGSDINCCIIVDRDVDFISTLLTPATYTSLLDEVFGIQSGFVELNDGFVIALNKQEIYLQVKNRHFSHVISFLKDKAKHIQEQYDKSQRMKLEEIKQYMKKDFINIIEQKKSLSHHISACEMIVKKLGDHFENLIATEENILQNISRSEILTYIEDCIAMNSLDKFTVLRLICLLSVVQNGLTLDEANKMKSQFLNAYGYQFLPLFYNLEKLGLFVVQQSLNLVDATTSVLASTSVLANRVSQVVPLSSKKSTSQQLIQKLKLIPNIKDNANLKNPSNMSYVFSGSFTPAICQLVLSLHSNEITKEDVPKNISNAKVEYFGEANSLNTFFVYFVGGVTYAEVAAFQLLEKLTGCQIIIGATNIINGNIVCESCNS